MRDTLEVKYVIAVNDKGDPENLVVAETCEKNAMIALGKEYAKRYAVKTKEYFVFELGSFSTYERAITACEAAKIPKRNVVKRFTLRLERMTPTYLWPAIFVFVMIAVVAAMRGRK